MKTLEINVAVEAIEDFNETAHVSTLELMGQVHIHVDFGHGILDFSGLVQHCDGIGDFLDANFPDIDSPMIALALNIFHRFGCDAMTEMLGYDKSSPGRKILGGTPHDPIVTLPMTVFNAFMGKSTQEI